MKSVVKYLKLLANIFFAACVLVGVFFVGPRVLRFFMPLVIGWILSMIANPLVRLLEKKLKIVRKHSSMLIIILVLAIVVGLGYGIVSKVVVEGVHFVNQIEPMYEDLSMEIEEIGNNLQGIYDRLPENIQAGISNFQSDIMSSLGNFVKNIGKPTVNFAKNLPSVLIAIIFTIISAYFFIAQREEILTFGRAHTPESIQKRWAMIYQNFKTVIGGYFKAQFKIMIVVFVILWIGMLILGVNFSVLVAFFVAFLDALPFFGTGTALVPWAVFEMLAGNYKRAIGLLVIYGVSQLVRQLIQPKMVGDSIGLNPMIALIFMFIGYKVSGVIGMIFAVPVGVILMNLYKVGVFDNFIRSIKIVVHDFNRFRKIQEEDEE